MSLVSLESRVMCAFFQLGPVIKSGERCCQDADQRLGCHRAVLFSRQCSQTSAGVWQVKNQHLTAPNKRWRGEWCTSMLERHGETKRRNLSMFSSVLGSQRGVFPTLRGCCPLETTSGQADASCSRGADVVWSDESCEMFEKICNAWVRRLKACVAATSMCAARRHSANTRS